VPPTFMTVVTNEICMPTLTRVASSDFAEFGYVVVLLFDLQ